MTRMPDLIAEVGFSIGATTSGNLHLDDPSRGLLDTATLGDTGFADISDFCRSVSIHRGSSRVQGPIVRYEAGTSTAVLRNEDRRFDPTNLDEYGDTYDDLYNGGPYVSDGRTEVEPMRVVRFRAKWDGVIYDLWRGYADSWNLGYNKTGRYSEVILNATDGFKILGNQVREADVAQGSGEDAGARVTRILNSTDWPLADRLIATGDTVLQATTLEGDPLEELFLVSDTEIGEAYIDGAGRFVFRNRLALIDDERSNTSQGSFGDTNGTLPYDDLGLEYDETQLVNKALISREGGTQQVSTDEESMARYLIRTHERSDLLMTTDAAALDYARIIVYLSKDPELRFSQLVIKPLRDPEGLFPQVLGREIGDRITIELHPPPGGPPITKDVFIRGISHEIGRTTWSTTWTLQSATKWAFMVLDDPILGALDSNALSVT